MDGKERSKIVPAEIQVESIMSEVEEKKLVKYLQVKVSAKKKNLINRDFNKSVPKRNAFTYIKMVDNWTQTSPRPKYVLFFNKYLAMRMIRRRIVRKR